MSLVAFSEFTAAESADWYCAEHHVHNLDDGAPLGVGHAIAASRGVDVGEALAAALVRNDHVLLGHVAGGHGALGTGRDVGDLKKGGGVSARAPELSQKKVRAHRHVTPERTARGGPDADLCGIGLDTPPDRVHRANVNTRGRAGGSPA